jgi:hypothetical protein
MEKIEPAMMETQLQKASRLTYDHKYITEKTKYILPPKLN